MSETTENANVDSANRDLIRRRLGQSLNNLLDLGRRNPLVSTRFSARSNSFIRVVDELPEVLFNRITNGNSMHFASLPDLHEKPPDEATDQFQSALAAARRHEAQYRQESESADAQDEAETEVSHKIERDLRDRVRESLKLPPRRAARNDLVAFAHTHGISPSYELPDKDDEHPDGRHKDDEIQTLLLPEDLHRKLGGLARKCKEWSDETGIGVLNAAFGFLEWVGAPGNDPLLSPLVLVPAVITKTRQHGVQRFSVESEGDEPETNGVLVEKLRREFGIELPLYTGGPIEEYLGSVASVPAPPHLNWRVRRQVCYGVFPSPNMALHRDIEVNLDYYVENSILSDMLGGRTSSAASPRALDYDVDDPEIERKVPFSILDADSSQFSVMVDIANGKTLAVEGPPGTGKSQTIVNVVASALARGQKVLFVASKAAALNVVKSRLDAVGLGEFCLALRADRSSRKELAQSLRERVFMEVPEPSDQFELKRSQYRAARDSMSEYLDLIGSDFRDTGLTIHEILGANISATEFLESRAIRLTGELDINCVDKWDPEHHDHVLRLAGLLEDSWTRTSKAPRSWQGHQPIYLDRFGLNDRLRIAERISETYLELNASIERLKGLTIDRLFTSRDLKSLHDLLSALPELSTSHTALVARVCQPGDDGVSSQAGFLSNFLEHCVSYQTLIEELEGKIVDPNIDELHHCMLTLQSYFDKLPLDRLDEESVALQLGKQRAVVAGRADLADRVDSFATCLPEATLMPSDAIQIAHDLVDVGRDVLTLRNEFNCSLNNLVAFEKFLFDAFDLTRLRDDVLTFSYVPEKDRTANEMRAEAAALRGGTSFFTRLFSSDYKAAKKHYLTISKRLEFLPEQAAADMLKVADFVRQSREFRDDRRGATLFGLQFEGIESDLDQFKLLYDFVSKIHESFADRNLQPLRDFLLTGERLELLSIPDMRELVSEPTLDDFLKDIRETRDVERMLTEFEEKYDHVVALGKIFHEPKSVGEDEFDAICTSYEELLDLKEQEASIRQNVQQLLGLPYLGLKTDAATYAPAQEAIEIVLSQPQISDASVVTLKRGIVAEVKSALDEALQINAAAIELIDDLSELTAIPTSEYLRRAAIGEDASVENFGNFFKELSKDQSGLDAWSAFAKVRKDLSDEGFGWAIDALIEESNSLLDLPTVIEGVAMLALMRHVSSQHGQMLARFRGATLDELRGRIADLDLEIIGLARDHARCEILNRANPPVGNGQGRRSTWTEMSLIDNEVNKKTRHLPVRDVIERAGESLLELKPCWMMPPLAVAQYVDANALKFDLCIIDEASQMRPEDAIGSLSRARQAMVVGDTNQLPPSNFFRTFSEDEDASEDEKIMDESILELANVTFRPARRLRWHYRSRDPSLIAFSNRNVYDNDLVVFPCADDQRDDMGVSFIQVEGIYQAGENPIEGSAMVDAAIRFMRDTPDRSLGLVTLNQKQRDLILDEIELAISKHEYAQEYVDHWEAKDDGLESFFVKNLENVQGDERDTIFIGTVYGPAQLGAPVMQRFGPVNGIAGKRRLNVLFSRAKQQIVTFSSMTAADIQAADSNPGRTMLKNWLEYVATGFLAADTISGKPPDSEFELFVIEQIEALGAIAVPQVGVSGYHIDIGVKHPRWPHGFILAVECDGASYHSSRSARDRDRLRQQVLEGLGWHFHRIWSTDWFRDPGREVQKLKLRIAQRLDELQNSGTGTTLS